MTVELTAETRKQAIASIRRYFGEYLDQDIGDLKAQLLLDYFLKEIAPSVHNAAIDKTQTYLRDRVADLEAVCGETEFAFWPKGAR